MQITEYAADKRPNRGGSGITFTPFATVKLDRGRELRIDVAAGPNRTSVSARLFRIQNGRSDNCVSEPIFMFPDQIGQLVAVLTAAATSIGVKAAEPSQ